MNIYSDQTDLVHESWRRHRRRQARWMVATFSLYFLLLALGLWWMVVG